MSGIVASPFNFGTGGGAGWSMSSWFPGCLIDLPSETLSLTQITSVLSL